MTEPLSTLVEQAAGRWPDDVMLTSRQGDSVTYVEYRDRVAVMAAGLRDLGFREGDAVSWILPTWVDTVVLAGALARIGAVQNPIIGIYRDREVGFCARQTGARFLITPTTFGGFDYRAMGERIASNNPGLTHLAFDRGEFPAGDPDTLDPAVVPGPNDVRWICYTSGTTADPKGARHTDFTLGSFPGPLAERLSVRRGSRYALVFPFPHIGGIGLLFMALKSGCTHLLDESVDPVETIDFLSREGCTHAGTGTPFYLMYLAAQAARNEPLFPDLEVCPGGGSPIPPALHYRIVEELGGAGIASGWGLTESPVLTNASITDPAVKRAETAGRVLPGVELRAVAADGAVCPAGVEGELRAKGPQMMLGYVDSSLDEPAFDENGFFCTGDLGAIDADGFVMITGRLKDVIIRNSENVSAKEVEDLLFQLDEVADAAVIGLPDERTGESVCAVVVPTEGAGLVLDSVRGALSAAGLRKQALPTRLEVVDSLPRSPAGKTLKRDLVERYS